VERKTASTSAARRVRVAAAILIVIALAVIGALLAPVYLNNYRLRGFVEELTHSAEARTQSDDAVRAAVLEKAESLGLPVRDENVLIRRSGDSLRIEVRYVVRVDFPLYTVDLHFYPGAGSR
jgi:hypothetical protein